MERGLFSWARLILLRIFSFHRCKFIGINNSGGIRYKCFISISYVTQRSLFIISFHIPIPEFFLLISITYLNYRHIILTNQLERSLLYIKFHTIKRLSCIKKSL